MLKRAGGAGIRRGTAAAHRVRTATAATARAATVMVRSATAAVISAVSSTTVLPVVVAIIGVVALLLAILPRFITWVGNQQHQQNTLSAACVASPYELDPVQPHVEQAAISLQPAHLPTRRPR